MNKDVYDRSIVATATLTNKSENQDDRGEDEKTNSMFIADGLGSYKYAKKSSELVINYLLREVKEIDCNSTDVDFKSLYKGAKQKLIDHAVEVLGEDERHDRYLFGTTAISVIETSEKIIIAYVGNGAIWHIRGNFNQFPSPYLFPWNAVNVLNPHTIPQDGKEALYRLISNNDDFSECVPSIIELEKDGEFGDIIMICTDGIYSEDQLKCGKNDKGIWIKYEQSMLIFFEYLTRFFNSNQHCDQNSLKHTINQYLEELNPMLDDDGTIGILVSKRTLNYQNEIIWLNNEKHSSNEA